MIRSVLIHIVALLPVICFGQDQIDGRAFLEIGMENLGYFEVSQNQFGAKTPFIEEIDFRTETSDYEFERQQYTLRFKPSTPKKRKAQKELAEHILNTPDFDHGEWKCELMEEIYEDWLDLYINEQEYNAYQELDLILQDKAKLLNKLASATFFDFNELIKLEKEQSEVRFFIEERIKRKNELFDAYGMEESTELVFDQFIDENQIRNQLLQAISQNASISEDAYEKELIKKEIDLEEAEKRDIIDFAEIEYQGPHDNLLKERISLGLAFTLNTSQSKNMKIKELGLELERLETKERRDYLENNNRIQSLKSSLLGELRSLEKFRNIHSEEITRLEQIGKKLTRQSSGELLNLLNIEERKVQIKMQEIELYGDLVSDFIRYLGLTGDVCLDSQFKLQSN